MRRRQFFLLMVIVVEIVLIGIRYQQNGGLKARVVSRVNKLESGFRDDVRRIEANHDVNSVSAWV